MRHLSPQACSRCTPLSCGCACHKVPTGHGPLCEWDEEMARMFCHPEHKARLRAASRARIRRWLRWVKTEWVWFRCGC